MLEIQGLAVAYGGLRALQGVSLAVAEGQFVTVVGPNGAGKTTLFKAVCGVVPPTAGRIAFEGRDLLALPAAARAHLGIAHVPEGRQVFKTLSVRENLEMGAYPPRGRARFRQAMERIHALFPVLAERAGQLAGTLSGGERQMLALGRALMSRPRMLMLDEPSLGLAPLIVREIFHIIASLRELGVSILLVEQNARAALETADFGYVLETGCVVHSGPAASLAHDPRVIASYLGGKVEPNS